jgi:hypothetical protein
MSTLEAGDLLDHYRLEQTVARGGMGTLFKATDLNNDRTVAIKVPHPEMEADPVLVERFRREEAIGQELDHPGVVKTYRDEQRSRDYMVIEWVEGRLLRTLMNEQPQMPIERAVAIMLDHLRCPGLHAQARRRPPRPEAGKHHGRCRGPHQADRLRHRHEGRCAAADLYHAVLGSGHAGLHLSGAGQGQARRSAQRHLFAGHHLLRDADRRDALQRAESAGGDERAPAAQSEAGQSS